MKNFTGILALFIIMPVIALSQQVVDFESVTMPNDGYYNGSTDHSGELEVEESFDYVLNNVHFQVNYTPGDGWEAWNGTAYSNLIDAENTGLSNQYSTYAGEAYSGNNFGIISPPFGGGEQTGYYQTNAVKCIFDNTANVSSIWVSNSTWGALSIKDGDAFNEAFTTTDNDYFKLVIEGKKDEISTGEIEFFLADYTGNEGIIIDDWQEIDLTSLGEVDKLVFSFKSTNYNEYGMTNPAYFCFDDLQFELINSIGNLTDNTIDIYPNPTVDFININNTKNCNIAVTDVFGKIIFEKYNCNETEIINLNNYNSGIYIVNIKSDNYSISKKIIKN